MRVCAFQMMGLGVGILALVALGAISVAGIARWRLNHCDGTLRQIEAAKEQYALEHGLPFGSTVTIEPEQLSYLMKGGWGQTRCPSGGKYTVNAPGHEPACSVHGTRNRIENPGQPAYNGRKDDIEREPMKTKTRSVAVMRNSQPTIEGAGVRLKRAFGFLDAPYDPFLLLDDFRGDKPADYVKGFPWHPHRGIETITYVLRGKVAHGDSMGNKGVIGAGDVQWMTAGSGIIHQEMPSGDGQGVLSGFQLWANLPAKHKMMDPRYREVKCAEIPEVALPGGARVKIISGRVGKVQGPVRDIVTDPEYLDVAVPAGAEFMHPTPAGYSVVAYVFEGDGQFGPENASGRQTARDGTLVVFSDGEQVRALAGEQGVRFLLMSGKPIREPVAWQGPIVMNTQEELDLAFEEYEKGTFIKHKR